MAFETSPRISVLLSRLTETRAGYLDELAAGGIPGDVDDIIADIGTFPTANYATLAAYVEDIRTRLIAIVADTGELQTDWADGGRLDLLIDAIKTQTDDLANGARLDLIFDDILADTDTIAWGDITTIDTEVGIIDGIVDSILLDTTYLADGTLPASPTAGSLARFIASGGTALGTQLPASKSLYDVIALDRLDNGTYGLSALDTDLGTLLTRISAARAGYLDNLIGSETAGTYNHPDGTTEQDAVEITPAELIEYYKLCLDLNALTQTTYIRTYVKVDGATYRLMDYAEYPTDYPANTEGVVVWLVPSSKAIKVTLESATAEGAIRAVPYFHVRHNLT